MIRLFKVFIPTSVVGLVLSEVLLLACCYFAAYYLSGGISLDLYLLYGGGATAVGIVILSVILGIYFHDLYSQFQVIRRILLVQQYCLIFGLAFLTQALLSYLGPELILARWHMIIGSMLALFLLPLWRMAYSEVVFSILDPQRVLFVGDGSLARQLGDELRRRPDFALASVGYLAPSPSGEAEKSLGPWRGTVADLHSACRGLKPRKLIIGLEDRRSHLPVYELLELRLRGVQIEEAASVYEMITGRVALSALRPSDLIFTQRLGPSTQALALQRAYSFLFALFGLLLTSLPMLVVAVLVRLTSPGPALYRQKRVGHNGEVFEVLKFRSMYVDAEARTGAVWATRDDPRITPLGRWLRKLRIDEFPQFFNVLKGDMAVVGPRPERPEFVKALSQQIPFYGYRHSILPGITGWAQINHKYGDTVEDTVAKLEYDLYYLKNVSFSLDAYIVFHTVKVMVLGRGSQ